jgi:hypothetical protein
VQWAVQQGVGGAHPTHLPPRSTLTAPLVSILSTPTFLVSWPAKMWSLASGRMVCCSVGLLVFFGWPLGP